MSGAEKVPEMTCTHLVGVLVRPAVYAVVRDVKAALGEPLDVSCLERAGHNGRVRSVPIDVLLGHLREGLHLVSMLLLGLAKAA